MQKVLGKEDAEKPKPRTIRDRINDLQHKQYIKGAQIFATQYTTMHKCAETNNLSGLGHFLRTGDVDARDRWGNTCLHLACEKGFLEFVERLLDHEADPLARNNKGWTAAHAACVGGHAKVFRALSTAGVLLRRASVGPRLRLPRVRGAVDATRRSPPGPAQLRDGPLGPRARQHGRDAGPLRGAGRQPGAPGDDPPLPAQAQGQARGRRRRPVRRGPHDVARVAVVARVEGVDEVRRRQGGRRRRRRDGRRLARRRRRLRPQGPVLHQFLRVPRLRLPVARRRRGRDPAARPDRARIRERGVGQA